MKVDNHPNKKVKSFVIVADDFEAVFLKDKFPEELTYITRWKKYKVRRTLKNYNILKVLQAEFSANVEEIIAGRKASFVQRYGDKKIIADIKNSKNYDIPGFTYKTEPWLHQRIAVKLGISTKALGLLMDMRTGKTFVLANIVSYFKQRKEPHKTLVLATKQTMYNTWVIDVQKHTNLKVCVLDGGSKKILKRLESNQHVIYDNLLEKYLWQQGEADLWIINHDALRNAAVQEALANAKFAVLQVDESHSLKNSKSKRTIAAFKVRDTVDRCYISTGTLITRTPEDAYTQMQLLNPFIFNMDVEEFKHTYGHYKTMKGRGIEIFLGLKKHKAKELWEIVDSQSYKVAIEDCHDMPAMVFSRIPVLLTPEERKYHDELYNELISYVVTAEGEKKQVITTALGKLAKICQVTSGFIYHDALPCALKASSKLSALKGLLDEVLSWEQRKIVIWANFKYSREMIEQLLIKQKIGYAKIDSNTKDITAQVKRFDNIKLCRAILCSIRCGALGQDFSVAGDAVYYDNSFMYDHRKQSERRIYTHKSKELHGPQVRIHDLVAMNSVDEMVMGAITKKRNLSDFVNAKSIKDFYARIKK